MNGMGMPILGTCIKMPYKDRASITLTRERKEELEGFRPPEETWDHYLGRMLREALGNKAEYVEEDKEEQEE